MDIFLLEKLKNSKETVFSIDDIYKIIGITKVDKTTQHLTQLLLRQLLKESLIFRPRKNIYTINNSYSRKELACKLYSNSYISFETVLADNNLINYNKKSVTVACYVSRVLGVGKDTYIYRELKKEIINNNLYISSEKIKIADIERAFLDLLYIVPKFKKFKNLEKLNKNKIKKLLPIYNNKSLNSRVSDLLGNLLVN